MILQYFTDKTQYCKDENLNKIRIKGNLIKNNFYSNFNSVYLYIKIVQLTHFYISLSCRTFSYQCHCMREVNISY